MPYGFRLGADRKTLEVDQGEQDTLKRIHELAAAGVNPPGIAAQLEAAGIPRGKRWHVTSIRRLLARSHARTD